ncbi:MAG: hypothetical protein ACRCV3_05355 [Desulfovibrionaceae bacterium]
MYNDVGASSILLIGKDRKSIRFEATMLRSVGVSTIRALVDVEEYLEYMPIYPIDAIFIQEEYSHIPAFRLVNLLRKEYESNVAIVMIFSSSPSVSALRFMEQAGAAPLLRPYTKRDVQRALVQSKRYAFLSTTNSDVEYPKFEFEREEKSVYDEIKLDSGNDNFLVIMANLQFFLISGLFVDAAKAYADIVEQMSDVKMYTLISRTVLQTKEPEKTIENFCLALEKNNYVEDARKIRKRAFENITLNRKESIKEMHKEHTSSKNLLSKQDTSTEHKHIK